MRAEENKESWWIFYHPEEVGDEVFGLIKQIGLKPRIINDFYPWGGGFNICFEPEQHVVEAWQKSGEAADEVHARLMEKIMTVENENKELKGQLKFAEAQYKEKHTCMTWTRHEMSEQMRLEARRR